MSELSHRSTEQWRAMGDAPKDGTSVLLYWPALFRGYPHTTDCVVGYWRDPGVEESHWQAGNIFCSGRSGPTRWMPLPEAP